MFRSCHKKHTHTHNIYIYCIYIIYYIYRCHFNLHTRNILPSYLHPHYSRRNVISSIFCAASQKRARVPSLSLFAFHFNYFRPKVDTGLLGAERVDNSKLDPRLASGSKSRKTWIFCEYLCCLFLGSAYRRNAPTNNGRVACVRIHRSKQYEERLAGIFAYFITVLRDGKS